jgi:hypothetical protein
MSNSNDLVEFNSVLLENYCRENKFNYLSKEEIITFFNQPHKIQKKSIQ